MSSAAATLPSASRFLDPGVVAGIGNLELAARVVVEGALAGRHRSLLRGLSTEFAEHRPYRAGDDLKHLDWKLLARTDRLYTRRFRDTTSLSVALVLDTSASMDFPSAEDGAGISRFDYARILVAALAWITSTGGDAVGLLGGVGGGGGAGAGDGAGGIHLPARGGRRHLRSLLARLDALEPGVAGPWDPAEAVERAAMRLRRRGLVILVSDLYDREDEAFQALRRAMLRGHDAALLQLTSPVELEFPWRGAISFEDAESGATRLVDAGAAAELHRRALAAFHRRCAEEAGRQGIDHHLVSTAEAPAAALRRFLLTRARRG